MATGEEQSKFDELLEAMPRIAEAVKAFPESVQPQAFERLMAELTGRAPSGVPGEQGQKERKTRKLRQTTATDETKPTRRKASSPTSVRDLDLAPDGKPSLKDFVAEKRPKTNHDRNALSVYYLSEILGIDAVTVDHVFTCYKDMRWREPVDLANNLSLTANRKRFIDTANRDDIKITPAGRNHIEHDLPPKTRGD